MFEIVSQKKGEHFGLNAKNYKMPQDKFCTKVLLGQCHLNSLDIVR